MNYKFVPNEYIITQKTNIRNNYRNYKISSSNINEIEKHQIQNKLIIFKKSKKKKRKR